MDGGCRLVQATAKQTGSTICPSSQKQTLCYPPYAENCSTPDLRESQATPVDALTVSGGSNETHNLHRHPRNALLGADHGLGDAAMKPPAIWYQEQDLSQHYMRRTDRPWEEGVSRGQVRCIESAYKDGLHFGTSNIYTTYSVIADNRMSKGRCYGMRLMDCLELCRTDLATCFDVYSPRSIVAAAFCVFVKPDTVYVSGWSHIEGVLPFSPVPFLCKGIFDWCAANNFTTLDIGIGGDPGLDAFKERLAFKKGVPC